MEGEIWSFNWKRFHEAISLTSFCVEFSFGIVEHNDLSSSTPMASARFHLVWEESPLRSRYNLLYSVYEAV